MLSKFSAVIMSDHTSLLTTNKYTSGKLKKMHRIQKKLIDCFAEVSSWCFYLVGSS